MARRSSMARYRLGDLLERQVQVEDLAGVDLAVPDEVDQLGQEAAHRRGTAVQVDVREEDLLAWELNAVSDTDVADVPAWPGGADGLHLDSWVPTASITECAPSPLVSSLILATPSSPRSSTMSVAPNSRASFCRGTWRLMAMIRSAPRCRAASTASRPTAPSPTTATVLPGPALAATAPNQPVPSTSEAARKLGIRSFGGRSGVATRVPSASGTRASSACVPMVPMGSRWIHALW